MIMFEIGCFAFRQPWFLNPNEVIAMAPKDSPPHGHRTAGGKSEAGRFSRILAVETVPDAGLDLNVFASEAERAGLAAEFGLIAVQSFEADFHVRKRTHGRFKVSGALQALVTQTCVVT